MTGPSNEANKDEPRDAPHWAPFVDRLEVSGAEQGAPGLVHGRRVQGPLQGFGKMWQKTYRIRLDGTVSPRDVVAAWKAHFSDFWPKGSRFYPPLTGIEPGEVALISVAAGPMRLSTGVLVLYADEESFTLMTPQGHMLAGWITFSAFTEDEQTVAQTQVLMRAQDPLAEVGLRFGGHGQEDRFWEHALTALAAHFGAEASPETTVTCVDPRCNWGHAMNVRYNAGIRTTLHAVTAPTRWLARPFRRSPEPTPPGADDPRGPVE